MTHKIYQFRNDGIHEMCNQKNYFTCELETQPVIRWIYTNKNGRFYIYPKASYIPKMEYMPKLEIHGNGKVTFSEDITYR